MTADQAETPPDSESGATISKTGRRSKWDSRRVDCERCGTAVKLNTRHYYVALRDAATASSQDADDEEFVFCSKSCLTSWKTSRRAGSTAEATDR